MYDVIIVGSGPAGLSAALVLGRCRRKVLLLDNGEPRNARAIHLHGFLSRDGVNPNDLLRISGEQLIPYGTEIVQEYVVSARALESSEKGELDTAFSVTTKSGAAYQGRKLLLATGVQDILPEAEGIRTFYGRGVHHCPYCDGWEYAGQPLAAFGSGTSVTGLALSLKTWSDQVVACTHGEDLDERNRERLAKNGIALRTERVLRLEGEAKPDGMLQRIAFESGPSLPCAALFFSTEHVQHCELPEQMGCTFKPRNEVQTEPKQRTGINGLYLAGDADGDVQFVIVAAAEGATAAVAINKELEMEDWVH